MDKAQKHLLVLDEAGTLSSALLERLKQICVVLLARACEDMPFHLHAGGWEAVLIVASGSSYASLALAFYIKEAHPDVHVMLLGTLQDPRYLQKAFTAGIDLIVSDDDVETLADAIAERLLPKSAVMPIT